MTSCDLWKLFFFLILRSKDSVVLKFERCEEDWRWRLRRCEVLIVLKDQVMYYWKYPAPKLHSWIHRWNQQALKERVSDSLNQSTSAIRNHHISTNHPKAELKDFTVICRDANTLHCWAKEALHICMKDPSLNRNNGKESFPYSTNFSNLTHN